MVSLSGVALEQGSNVRRRTHAQTFGDSFQRHRGFSPQPCGNPNLLRVALVTALQVRRAPVQGRKLLLGNMQSFGQGGLADLFATTPAVGHLADLRQQLLQELLTAVAPAGRLKPLGAFRLAIRQNA
ncbi:MAG TPA: hypothetical protein VHI52_02810 [Verrucomicrobiae bacterium]|nr:hypothetical protein [Verrucomicrobiae bacterium]